MSETETFAYLRDDFDFESWDQERQQLVRVLDDNATVLRVLRADIAILRGMISAATPPQSALRRVLASLRDVERFYGTNMQIAADASRVHIRRLEGGA